jgi:hypothetical protein
MDYQYLEMLVAAMRRAQGADMKELLYVAAKYTGKNVSKKSLERHLRMLREKHLLRIEVRKYRYYVEQDFNMNRFLAASVNNQFAEMVQVKGQEVPVFDLGYFNLGHQGFYMKDVISALKQSRRMEIEYKSLASNISKRRLVEPMFIRWYASQWYLFARDCGLGADEPPRAFRLDCIRDVRLEEPFVAQPDDAPGVFGRRFIGVSGHDADAQEVVLHVDAPGYRWLQATVDFEQLDVRAIPLEAPRGWVELHWTIDPNAEFMELLMRLRNSFRIVAPNSLKMQYKKRLLELLKAID